MNWGEVLPGTNVKVRHVDGSYHYAQVVGDHHLKTTRVKVLAYDENMALEYANWFPGKLFVELLTPEDQADLDTRFAIQFIKEAANG